MLVGTSLHLLVVASMLGRDALQRRYVEPSE